MKICGNYVGVTCVNGYCPKANVDEYRERDMDVITKCENCFYYEGCEDCALLGTEYCTEPKNGTSDN